MKLHTLWSDRVAQTCMSLLFISVVKIARSISISCRVVAAVKTRVRLYDTACREKPLHSCMNIVSSDITR